MRRKNKRLIIGAGLAAIVLSSGFAFRQVKVEAARVVCEPLAGISGETATQETVTEMEKCIHLVKDIPFVDQAKRDEVVKMEGMIPVLRSLLVARDAFKEAAEAFKTIPAPAPIAPEPVIQESVEYVIPAAPVEVVDEEVPELSLDPSDPSHPHHGQWLTNIERQTASTGD